MRNIAALHLCFVLAMAFTVPCAMGQLTDEQIEAINAYIRDLMDEENVPGLGLGIVVNGSITTAGFGYRDLENELPVTPNTLFGLASVTKGLTSALVVDYYLRNNMSLQDNIESYLPGELLLVDRYRSHHGNMIDLLSHRLCVDPQLIWLYTRVFHTREELLRRFRYFGEFCLFRTALAYNNVAFTKAGNILEVLSGKSWEELMTDNIYAPVGMNDSTFSQVAWENIDDLEMALVYYHNGSQFLPADMEIWSNTVVTNPAGGIVTTAADMARWAYVLLSRGVTPEGKRIIDEEVFQQLFTPNQALEYALDAIPVTELVEEIDMFYGLGFYLGVKDGYRRNSHAGTWANFDTQLTLYPQLNLGIFTCANGPGQTSLDTQKKIHDFIFYTVRGVEPPPVQKVIHKSPTFFEHQLEKGETPFVEAPEQYVGIYGNWSYGDMNVTLNDEGVLEFQYGDLGHGILYPTQLNNTLVLVMDHRFDYLGAPPLPFVFEPSEDGSIIETAHLISFVDMVFVRDKTLDTAPDQLWDNINC